MKSPLRSAFRALLPALVFSVTPLSAQAFVHPGMPTTYAELDAIKANLAVEPWKSTYAALLADSQSDLNRAPYGPWATVSNEGQWLSDMEQIYNCAVLWRLTGNTAYANKAMGILNAYTTTVTSFSLGYLQINSGMGYLAAGADLLRGYSGWTATMTTNAKNHFSMFWDYSDMGDPSGVNQQLGSANQGAANLTLGFVSAIYCDDINRFSRILHAYRTEPCTGLSVMQPNGQIGDTGRDQGHAYGEIAAYARICEMAWKQGVDLFGEKNNALLKAFEYYSNYNLGGNPAFVQSGTCYGLYSSIGFQGRQAGASGAHQIAYNHYVGRKGLSAPFTTQWVNTIAGQNLQSIPWKNAPGTPALGTPPAAAPAVITVPAATTLTSTNLGTVGVAGSATYSGGTWTVKGSGADMWGGSDNGQFAYRQLTGNGTIIARITSQQVTKTWCKAGIMMRDSLASNANTFAVWACAGGNAIQAFSRGGFGESRTQTAPAGVLPPYWLKIVRNGDRFFSYSSPDGVYWTSLNEHWVGLQIAMGSTIYVGLCVTSTDNTQTSTATFTNVAMDTTGGPVDDGIYRLNNRLSGLTMSVDTTNGGISNTDNVQQWTYSAHLEQLWSLTHLGGGRYRMIGVGSGKAFDISGNTAADGANGQIWTYTPSALNQQFTFAATSGGFQRITPVNSGRCVEVGGNSTINGGNVQQWGYVGSNSQQWLLQAP